MLKMTQNTIKHVNQNLLRKFRTLDPHLPIVQENTVFFGRLPLRHICIIYIYESVRSKGYLFKFQQACYQVAWGTPWLSFGPLSSSGFLCKNNIPDSILFHTILTVEYDTRWECLLLQYQALQIKTTLSSKTQQYRDPKSFQLVKNMQTAWILAKQFFLICQNWLV